MYVIVVDKLIFIVVRFSIFAITMLRTQALQLFPRPWSTLKTRLSSSSTSSPFITTCPDTIHSKKTWVGDYGLQIPDKLLYIRHRSRVQWERNDSSVSIRIMKKTIDSNGEYFIPIASHFNTVTPMIPSEYIGSLTISNVMNHQLDSVRPNSALHDKQNTYRFIPWKDVDHSKEDENLQLLAEADKSRRLSLHVDERMCMSCDDLVDSGILAAVITLLLHYRHIYDWKNINFQEGLLSHKDVDQMMSDLKHFENVVNERDKTDWITDCHRVLCPLNVAICRRLRLLHRRVGAASYPIDAVKNDSGSHYIANKNLLMTCYSTTQHSPFEAFLEMVGKKDSRLEKLIKSADHSDTTLQESYKSIDKDLMFKHRKQQSHEENIAKRSIKVESDFNNVTVPTSIQSTHDSNDSFQFRDEMNSSISLDGTLVVLSSIENFSCEVYTMKIPGNDNTP